MPVIFGDSPANLPLAGVLKWSAFSLYYDVSILFSKDKMLSVVDELSWLWRNMTHMHMLRTGMACARQLLDWKRTNFPSVYHLTLLDLLRMVEWQSQ